MVLKSLCSLAIVLSVLVSGASCQAQGFFGPQLLGQKAPGVVLDKLSGGQGDLLAMINGKPAALVFWATWCPHCREQLSRIAGMKAQLKDQDIAVVLINTGESENGVRKFLDSKGYDFDVLMDNDSQAAEAYQVVGIPTIVLIGADGVIRDIQYGFPDDYEQILK